MREYIEVDLGKRKAVVVKKDRLGKVTGKVTLAVTEQPWRIISPNRIRSVRWSWKGPGTGCISTKRSRSMSLKSCWRIPLRHGRLPRHGSRPTPGGLPGRSSWPQP